jgi:hypothetical protein
MYLMRGTAPIPAYLRPPSREVVDELAMLIERIQRRQTVFMQHWRSLCTASDDTPVIQPELLLEETYVPRLRSAIACLARGDTAGFFTSGRALGAELADAGVPFAAMVTHASFLKDGCADARARSVAVHLRCSAGASGRGLVAAAAIGYTAARTSRSAAGERGSLRLPTTPATPATVPLFPHGGARGDAAVSRISGRRRAAPRPHP